MYNIHAVGLCAIWTFCDIFILIGRYGRAWKYSYKLHSAVMTLVLTFHLLIVTIQAVSSEIATGHGNSRGRYGGHFWGMIIMTVVSFIIGLNGTLLESVYKTPNSKVSLYKPMMRKVHATLGFTMWAASKWTIHTMSDYIDYDWLKYSYLIGRIATPLFVLIMEGYRILGNKKEIKATSVTRIITAE